MANFLLIVESPGKIKKISAILGADWRVAASFGHIRDLPESDLGIDLSTYKPEYVIPPDTNINGKPFSKKSIVTNLKTLSKQFAPQNIYLGTDPDREGEAIAWHLAEVLGLKTYQRVTFGEVEKDAVLRAISNPRKLDLNLVAAQEARRCLDRIIGWPVSQFLSSVAKKRGLSAGRVQSPAVRLVVDRERAIKHFKPVNHFGAELSIQGWKAEWKTAPRYSNEQAPYVLDKVFAAKFAEIRQLSVQNFKDEEQKRSPPAPFKTTTMQQAGSVVFDFDPHYTMKLAQGLFESGHISYHRTDNPNISDDSFPQIIQIAKSLGLTPVDKPRKFKVDESAQVGHPAITPTHWEVSTAGESQDEQKLYELIRLRAIASQLADARYMVRTAILVGKTADGMIGEFEAKGRSLVFEGWKKLVPEDQAVEDSQEAAEPSNPVPPLKIATSLYADSGKLLEKATRRPPRFTLASLVEALEHHGIGRPATYAAIMQNIFGKKYVQNIKGSKKQIEPTDTGIHIVNLLTENGFSFVELEYTKYMESTLDQVASGKVNYKQVMEYFFNELQSELEAVGHKIK